MAQAPEDEQHAEDVNRRTHAVWLGTLLVAIALGLLAPVRRVAKRIRSHLWGILNAIMHGVTNAKAEAINSRIQWLKKRACGCLNRRRFRNAIQFHQGGLDLHPRPRAAHTIS